MIAKNMNFFTKPGNACISSYTTSKISQDFQIPRNKNGPACTNLYHTAMFSQFLKKCITGVYCYFDGFFACNIKSMNTEYFKFHDCLRLRRIKDSL